MLFTVITEPLRISPTTVLHFIIRCRQYFLHVVFLRRMSIWDLDIVSSFGNKAYFRNGSIFLGPSCVKEIQSRFSSSEEGSQSYISGEQHSLSPYANFRSTFRTQLANFDWLRAQSYSPDVPTTIGQTEIPAIKSKLTRVNKEIQWVCLVNWTGKQLRKTGNFHIEIISVFIYSLREGDLVRLLASFEKTRWNLEFLDKVLHTLVTQVIDF